MHGDLVDVLPTLAAESIDACVTDPPYDLHFMGKAWDGRGVAFRPDTWRAVYRVLKPGAYLAAFGGTRTSHRMVCAIEDAGFVIRDSLTWLYGQGFPKSLNLGHGRGTALKPASEPIALAWKPFTGAIAANVEHWGTGALNIDACRIGTTKDVPSSGSAAGWVGPRTTDMGGFDPNIGRWPANVVLDEDAAAQLDGMTGHLHAGGGASRFFYCAKPSTEERSFGCKRNPHPTVKPVELMRWLVKLVTPIGGTVLDPFLGSGTTGMACRYEHRAFVGIEREAEYIAIAERRMAAVAPLFGDDKGSRGA
jgi:DNA modification methylase